MDTNHIKHVQSDIGIFYIHPTFGLTLPLYFTTALIHLTEQKYIYYPHTMIKEPNDSVVR